MKNKRRIIILVLLLFVVLSIFLLIFRSVNSYYEDNGEIPDIPIVIISWNSLTFIRNFINQIKHLPNDIIIIDNNSTYPKLHEYYDELEKQLKHKVTIKRLKKNYGHEVYLKRRDLLPKVYILSDPDLQLNKNMPIDVSNILYKLSSKYKKFKVGLSLDISDSDKFEQIIYQSGKSIKDWESKFWTKPVKNDDYELYKAHIDTTFTLVNWKYKKFFNKYDGIRIAGNFTAKHLPWYKNFLKDNIPEEEFKYLTNNNKSSTIFLVKTDL